MFVYDLFPPTSHVVAGSNTSRTIGRRA